MSKTNMIIAIVVAVLVAGGGGFFGGMQYQKSKQPARAAFANGFPGGTDAGQFRQRLGNINSSIRGGVFGGIVRGEVTSISGTTVTVKQTDGSSKLVLLSATTNYSQSTSAAASDVIVGQTIQAQGTPNSDGSVTAQDLEINPLTRAAGVPITTPPAQ